MPHPTNLICICNDCICNDCSRAICTLYTCISLHTHASPYTHLLKRRCMLFLSRCRFNRLQHCCEVWQALCSCTHRYITHMYMSHTHVYVMSHTCMSHTCICHTHIHLVIFPWCIVLQHCHVYCVATLSHALACTAPMHTHTSAWHMEVVICPWCIVWYAHGVLSCMAVASCTHCCRAHTHTHTHTHTQTHTRTCISWHTEFVVCRCRIVLQHCVFCVATL